MTLDLITFYFHNTNSFTAYVSYFVPISTIINSIPTFPSLWIYLLSIYLSFFKGDNRGKSKDEVKRPHSSTVWYFYPLNHCSDYYLYIYNGGGIIGEENPQNGWLTKAERSILRPDFWEKIWKQDSIATPAISSGRLEPTYPRDSGQLWQTKEVYQPVWNQ